MKILLIQLLTSIDRRINKLISFLKKSNQKRIISINEQIGVKEWEEIYLTEPKPVTSLTSPVASYLTGLANPGDTFIELGCGSATLSAELAVNGQNVVLCDYSQSILRRARKLFSISKLPEPTSIILDIEKPLPFQNRQFEIVWNSGVLEHWEDNELIPIVREMARISRKYVISFVPNASSVFYRMGKYYAEQNGTWRYGKELPRVSLKSVFESAGLSDIVETTIMHQLTVNWLRAILPEQFSIFRDWWSSLPETEPVKNHQGYLLITLGKVE